MYCIVIAFSSTTGKKHPKAMTDAPATLRTELGTESRISLHGYALPGRHGNINNTSLTGNPDSRVPEVLEIDDGLRAQHVVEEEYAERAEETPRGGFVTIEETSNQREALHPNTQDRIEAREETEKRELRHVPGGTWLNQVRTCLKDSIWPKGRGTSRGEREGRLQGEGREFIGKRRETLERRKKDSKEQ
ncbi:hypothetical protein NDU88_001030 [Pleurodeles waltl]|uniref:Uncharacterized protein n=1 Tax=Pleurodeles waltl TaxID=8319 RepID=A0AAV7TGM8_PLEWA|nr:hypothetical protein NDU88_001030 [Pleurodeles waltl]